MVHCRKCEEIQWKILFVGRTSPPHIHWQQCRLSLFCQNILRSENSLSSSWTMLIQVYTANAISKKRPSLWSVTNKTVSDLQKWSLFRYRSCIILWWFLHQPTCTTSTSQTWRKLCNSRRNCVPSQEKCLCQYQQ